MSNYLPDGPLRLDRKKLRDRITMEYQIQYASCQWLNFVCLLLCVLCCMASYDPIIQVSNIHHNMRQRFQTDTAKQASSHEDIMAYVETFLAAAYKMAPALIDANTMNTIDYARCTDPSVSDICQLTYWFQDPVAGRVNRPQVLDDVLAPDNAMPSVRDCPHGGDSCVNRATQLNASLKNRTLSLLPEDPVILQSRLDYPIASIVPLTPILWQTRAKRKPCSGFGDKYNTKILGAGRCSVDINCDPDSVTAFEGTKPARTTNRKQTFYLTYSEDVFFCVDRKDSAEYFYDKSWSPWAAYEDVTRGRKVKAEEFNGQKVFYKFLSDIAYLQSPIPNTVRIPDTLEVACPGGVSAKSTIPPSKISDPLLSANHGLWGEIQDNQVYSAECSLRKIWSEEFLAKSRENRANSFLTLETTELTLSTLVLTPQSEEYADVQTLIRVVWRIDQGGTISSEIIMQSTSQTSFMWFVWVGLVIFFGLLEMFQGLSSFYGVCKKKACCCKARSGEFKRQQSMTERKHDHQALFNGSLDVVVALASISLVTINLTLELMPPDVSAELLQSFEANAQENYFKVFEAIVKYNESLYGLKQYGFCVICLQFVRFVLYLVLHPRMAVLVKTLSNLSDNLYHFLLYFIFINTILTFLGWWMFAEIDNINYGTFWNTFYTQARMFTGDFPFPEDLPPLALAIYLLIYTFMVFIILVNFLLAIVVDSYATIMEEVNACDIEQNVTIDIADIVLTWLKRRRWHYPNPRLVLMALERNEEQDSVDANDLFESMGIEARFSSIEHANQFLELYAQKLTNDEGNSVLIYSPVEEEEPVSGQKVSVEGTQEQQHHQSGSLIELGHHKHAHHPEEDPEPTSFADTLADSAGTNRPTMQVNTKAKVAYIMRLVHEVLQESQGNEVPDELPNTLSSDHANVESNCLDRNNQVEVITQDMIRLIEKSEHLQALNRVGVFTPVQDLRPQQQNSSAQYVGGSRWEI